MFQQPGNKLLAYLVLGLLCGFTNSICAQKDSIPHDTAVFTFTEKMPEYPGGQEKLIKLLSKNFKTDCITADTLNNLSCSKIWCDFIVDTTGNIQVLDAYMCRSRNECLKSEFERIFKLGKQWEPGKMNGKLVAVRMKIPVNIHLK